MRVAWTSRLFARLAATALLASLALALIRIVSEDRLVPWWWDAGGVLAFGLAAGLSGAGPSDAGPPGARLGRWAGWLPTVIFLALLLTLPALLDRAPPGGWLPWPLLLAPACAGALAVFERGAGLLVGLALILTAQGWVLGRVVDGVFSGPAQLAALPALAALGMALAVAAVSRQAKQTQVAERQLVEAEARVAARLAEVAEVARWDAMVHDEVLATLELAAQEGTEPAEVRRLASHTAEVIERGAEAGSRSVEEVDVALAALASAHGASYSVDVEAGVRVPAQVADALANACQEVLRNCQRHAAGAEVSVAAVLRAEGLSVVVADAGPGFAPDQVPAGRMGLQVAVRDPVRAVGGAVEVVSRPGAGTSVSLAWQPVGLRPGGLRPPGVGAGR